MFDCTEGGEVTGLKLDSATQTSISISWDCDVDSATYDLGFNTKTYSTTTKQMVFGDLTPGTEYTVTVYTKKLVNGVAETIGIAEEKFSTSK